MAGKNTELQITISTIDKASAKIRAINEEIDKATKPTRDLKKAFGELAEKSGLSSVVEKFKGVGEAVKETAFKFLEMGAIIGEATHLLLELVEGYEQLGKQAERLGVSVDFLAEMRDAAARTGVPVDALDNSLQAFNASLGQARAGTGRMAKFLGLVSPALLKQVKAAKDNAAAFDLVAGAMAKLEDPAKRAALAQKMFGDSALAPMFAKGPKALAEMREHYLKLAGSQQPAVEAATETAEAMHDLHAATDGVKASLVSGLAPALTVIIGQLTEWLSGHQADIKQWAADIGKKLPGAVNKVVDAIKDAVKWVVSFVDKIGGLKTVALALAAVVAGPLIAAFVSFGIALAPVLVPFLIAAAPALAAIAAIVAAVALAVKAIKELAAGGRAAGEWAARRKLFNQHVDEIKENNPDLSNDEIEKQAWKMADYDIGQSHAREDLNDRTLEAQSTGTTAPDISAQARAAMPDAWGQSRAARDGAQATFIQNLIAMMPKSTTSKVVIDVHGPRGTRAKTDPSSSGDVDLNLGIQMFGLSF